VKEEPLGLPKGDQEGGGNTLQDTVGDWEPRGGGGVSHSGARKNDGEGKDRGTSRNRGAPGRTRPKKLFRQRLLEKTSNLVCLKEKEGQRKRATVCQGEQGSSGQGLPKTEGEVVTPTERTTAWGIAAGRGPYSGVEKVVEGSETFRGVGD